MLQVLNDGAFATIFTMIYGNMISLITPTQSLPKLLKFFRWNCFFALEAQQFLERAGRKNWCWSKELMLRFYWNFVFWVWDSAILTLSLFFNRIFIYQVFILSYLLLFTSWCFIQFNSMRGVLSYIAIQEWIALISQQRTQQYNMHIPNGVPPASVCVGINHDTSKKHFKLFM